MDFDQVTVNGVNSNTQIRMSKFAMKNNCQKKKC